MRASGGFGGNSQLGSTAKEYFAGGFVLILVLACPDFAHGCVRREFCWRGQGQLVFTTVGTYTECEVRQSESSQRAPISGHRL